MDEFSFYLVLNLEITNINEGLRVVAQGFSLHPRRHSLPFAGVIPNRFPQSFLGPGQSSLFNLLSSFHEAT